MKAIPAILVAWLMAFLAIPSNAPDQCEMLRRLIANLQSQLEVQTRRLHSSSCSGSARSICLTRVRNLQQQIRNETRALQTCKNGVIPTSGISVPYHRPFDLLPRSVDDFDHAKAATNPRWDYFNNIPRNPMWAYQVYDGKLPNAETLCGVDQSSSDPSDWGRCTQDRVTTNHAHCFRGGGHVNWSPVTYEGRVFWHELSGDDGDYNIFITRDDDALYTEPRPQFVLMEFDSSETIDQFSEGHLWWKQFRSYVDNDLERGCVVDDPHCITGKSAVVIGLLGLDYKHESYSELHPLYLLAINYADLKWAFFARNWGNEGGCSEGTNPWDVKKISFLVENAEASDGKVVASAIFGSEGTSISQYFVKGQGLVLEIELPEPDKEGHVYGDFQVEWTSTLPRPGFNPAKAALQAISEPNSEESRLKEIFKRMSPARKQKWRQTKEALVAARPSGVAHPLTLQVHPTLSALVPPKGESTGVRQTKDTSWQIRKRAALCEALGTQRRRFPDLCKK